MTVQLEYKNHLQQFFKNISYYAGIMLNAFSDLLCSKLCWHNRLVPSIYIILYTSTVSYDTSSTKRVPQYRKSSYKVMDSVFRGNHETRAQRRVNASANIIVEVAIRLRTWSDTTVRFVVGKVRGARSYMFACMHACFWVHSDVSLFKLLSLGILYTISENPILYRDICTYISPVVIHSSLPSARYIP